MRIVNSPNRIGEASALRHARQPVGGKAADRDRDEHRARRDDQAVDQVVNKAAIEPDFAMELDRRLEKKRLAGL